MLHCYNFVNRAEVSMKSGFAVVRFGWLVGLIWLVCLFLVLIFVFVCVVFGGEGGLFCCLFGLVWVSFDLIFFRRLLVVLKVQKDYTFAINTSII